MVACSVFVGCVLLFIIKLDSIHLGYGADWVFLFEFYCCATFDELLCKCKCTNRIEEIDFSYFCY